MREGKRQQLAAKFRRLTRERVASLSREVVALEHEGSQAPDATEEIARELHTLKGEARLLGFGSIADIAHRLEARVQSAVEQGSVATAGFVSEMLEGLDAIDALVDRDAGGAEGLEAATPAAAKAAGLRVDPARLSRLADNATHLALAHSRSEALLSELDDIASSVDVSAQVRIRHVLAKAKQQARATESAAAELLDDVRQLQMVPLAVGLARYPRAVRDLAVEQGKRVRLSIEVGSVQIDRNILDTLHEPLLHLLRNCVDHGCEGPDERRVTGKPDVATIRVFAELRASNMNIVVRDDGRGIAIDEVLRVARDKGLVDADAPFDSSDAHRLVFSPGFSTRDEVTHISGRGIGLDVVQQRVEELGGSVRLESSPGEGTVVALRIPVSSMQVNALVVSVGSFECSIPIEAVIEIISETDGVVERPGGALAMRYDDALIPLRDLGAITGVARQAQVGRVVIVDYAQDRYGLLVDRVVGERQILHRGKGAFLAGSRILRDVGVTSDGVTMVVLDPAALAQPDAPVAEPSRSLSDVASRTVGTVLIADDSELTRDLLAKVIRERGHDVIEAVDGEDALAKIHRHAPDLVLTDLEMPRLDGFGLLQRLSASTEHGEIPVVVLSTRGDQRDVRRASELGAAAYLVKSEFHEQRLDRILARLVAPRDTSES